MSIPVYARSTRARKKSHPTRNDPSISRPPWCKSPISFFVTKTMASKLTMHLLAVISQLVSCSSHARWLLAHRLFVIRRDAGTHGCAYKHPKYVCHRTWYVQSLSSLKLVRSLVETAFDRSRSRQVYIDRLSCIESRYYRWFESW